MQIRVKNQLLDFSSPCIMGIINVTPDSFFSHSRIGTDHKLLSTVERMLNDGADIIDIGGYSTRPNADNISQETELKRLDQALKCLFKAFPEIVVSIDTFRSGIIRELYRNYPISIVNDISGGSVDDFMYETISDLKLTYILMHSKGNPQTMHANTNYTNMLSEILQYFEHRIALLRQFGVNDIIIDPGFGFSKTLEQNYKLLNKMDILAELDVPILAGISRKSMIYKALNINAVDALNGTTALNMLALTKGANILRVHDVAEAKETIKLYNLFVNS